MVVLLCVTRNLVNEEAMTRVGFQASSPSSSSLSNDRFKASPKKIPPHNFDPELPPSNDSIYPLLSLRSSSSFLRLLPCLLVTSVSPFIFPSITCFRRQFLRKMWPIQLATGKKRITRSQKINWLECVTLYSLLISPDEVALMIRL